MTTRGAVLAVVVAVAAPIAAGAAEPFLGARVGYALPFGDVAVNRPIRELVRSDVPLQLDAGFLVGGRHAFGAYLSYAFAQLASTADRACGASSCSADVVRLGAAWSLRNELDHGRDLWGGVLAGAERLDVAAPGSAVDATAYGAELGLEGGVDFARGSARFGPFASGTLGRFFSISGSTVGFDRMKSHVALQLGFRGFFTL
jgi:hypothetical protein